MRTFGPLKEERKVMVEMVVESIRRQALDRVELSGAAMLLTYAALAFGMYLQYVQPS